MPQQFPRRFAIASVAMLLAALYAHAFAAETAPAADGATHDLRYKLPIGTVLRYAVDHRAAIRSTIDETTQEAQTKTESLKAWKVTDVLPNRDIEFMNVVERVHMVNHLPDRAPVEYDSQKDNTPPPGYEDTARAIGIPLSVVGMTPRGKVVSHHIKHRQPAADNDAQFVVRLPDKPVAVGATWDEPFDVTVQVESGGTKSIQTRRHYELKSVAGGIATIEATYQVLSPIDSQIESQLVQRLMKGTVRFDVEKGRIDSQLLEVDKRILGFAGPTSSMHYVMRMEERLSDEKFAAKKPAAAASKKTASSAKNDNKKTSTARHSTPSRRPPSRSANRNAKGQPTHSR